MTIKELNKWGLIYDDEQENTLSRCWISPSGAPQAMEPKSWAAIAGPKVCVQSQKHPQSSTILK